MKEGCPWTVPYLGQEQQWVLSNGRVEMTAFQQDEVCSNACCVVCVAMQGKESSDVLCCIARQQIM